MVTVDKKDIEHGGWCRALCWGAGGRKQDEIRNAGDIGLQFLLGALEIMSLGRNT